MIINLLCRFSVGTYFSPLLDSQHFDCRFSVMECVLQCLAQGVAGSNVLLYVQFVFCSSFWFFELLREACHWHLPKPGLAEWVFTLPHAGLGKAFEETALAWIWHESGQVSPQGKHVSSCGLFVFYMAWGPWFFSWLYNSAGVLWLLLPCFALLCFCSFFFFLNYCMFLKTWFSWALMGYGTRSADQLHLGKSHLSNWEKINSWCPKETDINQAADVLEIQHWLPSLHSAILRSYLGTDFLRGSPLTVNSFDVLILPYFTTMSFILLLKGI